MAFELGALPLPLKLAALTQTVLGKGAGHGKISTRQTFVRTRCHCRREHCRARRDHRCAPEIAATRASPSTPTASQRRVRTPGSRDARERRSVFRVRSAGDEELEGTARRFASKNLTASLSSRMARLLSRRGGGQFGPDALPVVGAEVAPRYGAIRRALNIKAPAHRHGPNSHAPLVEERRGHSDTSREFSSPRRAVPVKVFGQVHSANDSISYPKRQ